MGADMVSSSSDEAITLIRASKRKRLAEETPPSPSHATTGGTEWIFICGPDRLVDTWLFADCMGFFKAFGDLLLPSPKSAQISFGFRNEHGDEPIAVFYRTERPFWKALEATQDPKRRVLDYLEEVAARIPEDGTLNLFLICHGYGNGDFNIAGSRLTLVELDEILGQFPENATLNLTVKACFSGHTVKTTGQQGKANRRYVQASSMGSEFSYSHSRYGPSGSWRGSPFAQAATSLMFDASRANATLDEHVSHISDKGVSGHGKESGHPVVSHNYGLACRAIDVFMSAYVQVSTRSSKRFRVASVLAEGPQSDTATKTSESCDTIKRTWPQDVMMTAYEVLMNVLREEASLLRSVRQPDRFDHGILQTYHELQHDKLTTAERFFQVNLILVALQWRLKMQKHFILAFVDLLKHRKLSPASVDNGVKFSTADPAVHTLADVIQCFEIGAECGPGGSVHEFLRDSLSGQLDSVTTWFATAILRSNVDPNEVLRHLMTKKYLGDFDRKFQESIPSNDADVFEDEVQVDPNPVPQLFFVMPNGVNRDMK